VRYTPTQGAGNKGKATRRSTIEEIENDNPDVLISTGSSVGAVYSTPNQGAGNKGKEKRRSTIEEIENDDPDVLISTGAMLGDEDPGTKGNMKWGPEYVEHAGGATDADAAFNDFLSFLYGGKGGEHLMTRQQPKFELTEPPPPEMSSTGTNHHQTQERTSASSSSAFDENVVLGATCGAAASISCNDGSDRTPIPEAFLVDDPATYEAEIVVPAPWYKQKRFVLPVFAGAGVVAGVVGSGFSSRDQGGTTVAVAGVCRTIEMNCGEEIACPTGKCCSQFGYCGITEDFCGECCQNGDCWDALTFPTLRNSTYTAEGDSRLMAYLGNWDECPTPAQIQPYSHIVISFAVTYKWSLAKNICNEQCDIEATLGGALSICGNENRQGLVDAWREQGKKVVLGFGGSGMGVSTSQDQNNCWDYCFGKEEELAINLTKIVRNQNFDGIEIDYAYCYDTNKTQYGRCVRRSHLYSDEKAQIFLSRLTSELRSKLDAIPGRPTRQRYELSHKAFDVDLIGEESPFFKILQEHSADIDYVLGRFYSGITQPAIDGLFFKEPASAQLFPSAGDIYATIVNGIFGGDATKVVFGFCISGCSSTLTNTNSSEAVKIMRDLKSYNNGTFACAGGASFWRALNDQHSSWSSSVVDEIMLTSGCANDKSIKLTHHTKGHTIGGD